MPKLVGAPQDKDPRVRRTLYAALSLELALTALTLPIILFWVDIPNRDAWLTPWGSAFPLAFALGFSCGTLASLAGVIFLPSGKLRAFAGLWLVTHLFIGNVLVQGILLR